MSRDSSAPVGEEFLHMLLLLYMYGALTTAVRRQVPIYLS